MEDRFRTSDNSSGLNLRTVFSIILVASFTAVPSRADSLDFRTGWRFFRGDAPGAQAPELDDSAWRAVQIPHDWAIEGPVNPEQDGNTGKLPWRGVGWYRKSFTLDRDAGDRVYLDFDGAMAFPKIYVNGKLAGEWDYGYTSFRIDATPYINNGINVLAVRLDTRKHGTRWYPGAGLYRKVTLTIERPVHIGHWGTYVTTPKVTDEVAEIRIRSTIENHHKSTVVADVDFSVVTPEGKAASVAPATQRLTLSPGANEVLESIYVNKPQLWDVKNPKLYTLRTTVREADTIVDVEETAFGIRTFQFTANDGFHLNGRRLQLQGVNLHHDHGPLGAAFYVRAMERQLEIMRDMGVNAVRTSHNPPAPELLDLCDRMGILVWDECFDKWNETADRVDSMPSHQEHAIRHLGSMVKRDRNHPSIVVWSIGNEILSGGEGLTQDRVKFMSDVVRGHDASRPVGMGCHIPHQSDERLFDALDLTGWNYDRRYDRFRQLYPDKPIIYSESASALSTRGFYELPLPKTKTDYSDKHQVNSYDFNAAPWSDIADVEFQLMQNDRFVAGEFVWTGFDYLGEPTPFEQQAKSSYFGIVDLCGIPKDRYFLYRSHWRPETTTVHILPHWNWPDHVGKHVPVFVYTNGDSAELFLNGKSLGMQKKGVRLKPPENLASGRPASASSYHPNHPCEEAADDLEATCWFAANNDVGAWWQVDFGRPQPLKCFIIEFDREAKHYGYAIQKSDDGATWEDLVVQAATELPRWGGTRTAVHDVDARAQFVRIVFTELPQGSGAGMREFVVCDVPAESKYYDPTYAHRLRWDDVIYEPGELRAVAYNKGREIGTAVVRTARDPAAIRLTPDRTKLEASGVDLCYLLVEAVDENGTVCPLADNMIRFAADGPGEIVGVGNGDPLSIEPFQAAYCRLFFGKAMLIVRTVSDKSGELHIVAKSDGLAVGRANCQVAPLLIEERP